MERNGGVEGWVVTVASAPLPPHPTPSRQHSAANCCRRFY